MLCKYCHLKTHNIDECPTIICKSCHNIGHPQWLCKNKKPLSSHQKNENIQSKKNEEVQKKLSDYIKVVNNVKWGDF
jgi:hypothetical protein